MDPVFPTLIYAPDLHSNREIEHAQINVNRKHVETNIEIPVSDLQEALIDEVVGALDIGAEKQSISQEENQELMSKQLQHAGGTL